jgi:hypothetical protein
VHHDIYLFLLKDFGDQPLVPQVANVGGDPMSDGSPVAVDKAVENDRLMPRGRKLPNAMTSDITGSPDNKYVHE